jgi:PAS domain S-box-containing protein
MSEKVALDLTPLLESLFEQLIDGVVVGHADGRVLRANQAACRLLGGSEQEIVARGRDAFVEEEPSLRAYFAEREARGRATAILRVRRIDGPIVRLELTSSIVRAADDQVLVFNVLRDVEGRERAAAVRAESEALLRVLFETIPDPLFIKDRQSRWSLANPATLAAVGRTLEQVIGRSDLEIHDDPAISAALMENDRRVIDSGVPSMVEETVRGSSGDRTFLATRVPFRDESGVVVGLIGHAIDLGPRRRALELEALQTAIETLPIGVVVVEVPRGGPLTVVAFNPTYADLLGSKLEPGMRASAMPAFLFLPDRTTPLPSSEWPGARAVIEGMTIHDVEVHIRRPDGSFRVCSVSAAPVRPTQVDGVRRAVVVLLDQTEAREAQERLRTSEAKFRALVEEAAEPFFMHDFEGRFREVNRAACASLGYAREELLRMGICDVEVRFDLVAAQREWREIPRGATLRMPGHHRRKDGSTFQAEIRLTRIDVDGEWMMIGIVRDVTEERAERERLRALTARVQAAREEEQARIARDLHDDLGQLLTALNLELHGAEELLEGLPLDDHAGAIADRVVAASELGRTMVGAVQRLAQGLRPIALEHLGLEGALRAELRRFEARTGLALDGTLRLDAEPSKAVATALYRIAQEALTNVARHAEAERVEVHLETRGEDIVLRVVDDGRGLQGREPGASRLGLLGMQERARALGGEVTITPAKDRGTLVTARVPRRAEGGS